MQQNKPVPKILLLTLSISLFSLVSKSQDSTLLKDLTDSITQNSTGDYTTGTFKATQIINTPTIEGPAPGVLQFLINHRFGKINEGAYALFGLDNAGIRFAFDYGINDRIAIGVGRSSFEKVYDASLKWKLLRQRTGKTPISISLFEMLTHTSMRYNDKPFMNARYRTAYQSSLLFARKFNSQLSLQLTPTWLHYNLVPTPQDKNDAFALGLGGRMKLTKRTSINAEYNYYSGEQSPSLDTYHSLSFGVDIETGGHVFQLIFSNSQGMVGSYYLGRTMGSWGNGDIYFGFNISRAFNLKKDR